MRFPPTLGWRDVVSAGNVGVVIALDAVIKIPLMEQDQHYLDIERQVYERLANDHDGILRYHGPLYNGILLQRIPHGSLRQHYARKGARSAALQMRWIRQIVESIVFIHSRGILHGDISCNNVFLDNDLNAKLGDFAGSSIDGVDSLVCYETRYDHPSTSNVTVRSEIFALGSMIYETLTGHPPYKDLSEAAVEDAYAREEYPDLSSISIFEDVITKCWSREYASADELLLDVNAQGNK